jgi:hypothetical protein
MRKTIFIIGLSLIIGLTIQVNEAMALYSPRLSQQVAIIRQHVQESQAQNGSQSILEEIEQFKAYDRAKKAAFEETGIAGEARVAQSLIFDTTLNFLIQNPFDSLFMVFNFNGVNQEFISTCLRDEIWNLETLRDLVGSEMVKAYMLRDTFHGALLMEDYQYLTTHLDLLRRYGSDPSAIIQAGIPATGEQVEVTSTKYFFGSNDADNYYRSNFSLIANEPGCPDNEFEEAFKEVINSAKTLSVLGSGQGVEWGDIWKIAQANARIRAREWIRANQITLTVGGENGGRVESLVKGGGWDKFVGSVKTQLQIARNMVGPVTPLWNLTKWSATQAAEGVGLVDECVFYYKPDTIAGGLVESGGVFRNCNDEQKQQFIKCQDDEEEAIAEGIRCDRFRNTEEYISVTDKLNRQLDLELEHDQTVEDLENAFIYSISLDSVGEQNLYQVDQIMWDINMHIKRGYEKVHKEAGPGIPTLTTKVGSLGDKQCANKGG